MRTPIIHIHKIDRRENLEENKYMKKKIVLLGFTLICIHLFSYWEWTPQTRRWINPKYAVKDTPKEQFEWAEKFRKEGDVDKAIREHKKLIKHFPSSEFAPKSCFILGEIYREKGKYKVAFNYYQKIIDNYPSSPLVFEAIKKQSEIGETFLKKKSRMPAFLRFNEEKRGEYLSRVIESSPFYPGSAERALKLGKFYYEIKEYEKAKEVFKKIIENYSQKKKVEEAKYYLIKVEFKNITESTTEVEGIKRIKEKIDQFMVEYPESKYCKELSSLREKLVNKEAEKYYKIARYYERAGKKKAAIFYYKIIAERYPSTEYGKIAIKKISSL